MRVRSAIAFFPVAGVALADGQAGGCSGAGTQPGAAGGTTRHDASVCVEVSRNGQQGRAANGADGTRGADGANGVDGVSGRVN